MATMASSPRAYLAFVGGTAWLAFAIHAVAAPGVAWGFFNTGLYNALIVLACLVCLARAVRVRAERAAWLALAAALCSWTAGDLYYALAFTDSAAVPFPSWSDAGYLGFYPFASVSLALLVRSRVGRLSASAWLDGLVAGFGTAAVGAGIVLAPLLRATHGPTAAVVTNLAYPIGDTLLIALVVCVFAASGWRPGSTWLAIAAGLVASTLADTLYLTQVASNSYVEGTLLDALWPAGLLLLAGAAWQPERRRRVRRQSQALLAPGLFGLAAIATGVYDHFAQVNAFAAAATAATLLCLMARAAVAMLENRRLLRQSQHEAVSDALTGLGNRRKLTQDLARVFAGAQTSPGLLALFDLDGFKNYNDRFGHPAGDAILQRLTVKLDSLVATVGGAAYRMGGDEFCVLLPLAPDTETTLAQCRVALSETGDDFAISASCGSVALPAEASAPEQALRLADQRLYASKNSNRISALSQSKDVLVRVLAERQSMLAAHAGHVADLAELTARRLGLPPQQVAETRLAAELHDVGKAAIPDAILNKPGPLDENEWRFMRRHSLIGERIVSAAPALSSVARIIRSSHERVDGRGYPDGLSGDDIPLTARVVAVADAFDAMTSRRPYVEPKTAADALAELRRCAGTQFDPVVVSAFAEVVLDGAVAEALSRCAPEPAPQREERVELPHA
jgi:diguanylate cyclase (GGDEF)-like protein